MLARHRACLRSPEGLYQNDISLDGTVNPTLWIYNSGAMIGAGALLYRAWRAGFFRRLPQVTPLLPLAIWLAVSVVPQGVSPLFDLAVVVYGCPLLIGLLLRGESQAPAWFTPLGAISYPLYASHQAWIGLARATPLFGLNHHPDLLRALFDQDRRVPDRRQSAGDASDALVGLTGGEDVEETGLRRPVPRRLERDERRDRRRGAKRPHELARTADAGQAGIPEVSM